MLVACPGEMITREEIQQKLWPSGTFVDFENGMNRAVNRLRDTLSDSAGEPKFIETIPRHGYRFIAPVDRLSGSVAPLAEVKGQPVLQRSNQWRWVASVAATVLLAGALAGVLTYGLLSPGKELKLRQLTANSAENPVVQSVISPDGRYLAFTDATFKIKTKILASDETLAIPEPESLKGGSVRWEIAAWFPDSTEFLANARPSNMEANHYSSRGASIWIVPLGGLPRKLRDDAEAFSVSPDGSQIAFGVNAADQGDREIWVMNRNGQEARRLFETDSSSFICCLQWSQDQRHAIYLKGDSSRAAPADLAGGYGAILSGDLKGGATTAILPISNLEQLWGFLWLPDGRLIYSLRNPPHGNGSLWVLQIDPHEGKPVGKPRLVSKFDTSAAFGLSATSDGKTIAFTRKASPGTIHIADIGTNRTRIASMKRLTLNEYHNQAHTWSPDSRSIISWSSRNGRTGLFRYFLDSDSEEPLVGGANNIAGAAVSPDGSWLLYLDCNQEGGCGNTLPMNRAPLVPLMRVPLAGGTPALVLKTKQYGRPRCAVSPSNLCVIAEQSEDGQPLIFTAFDAVKGRGDELCRFETERGAGYNWALSFDGTRIAILKGGDSRIHTIHLNGQPSSETVVRRWSNLEKLFWASDGKGWFTSAKTEAGWTLLHVDLEGNAERLWEHQGPSLVHAVPSPDGRHLAINARSMSGNAWMLENF
jgi:hypothetical protein